MYRRLLVRKNPGAYFIKLRQRTPLYLCIARTTIALSSQLEIDIGYAHLTFRTQPLGPEFGSGIEGQEFFLTLGNFPEPGIFP